MIELLLDAIVSLGSTEVQNVLTSVGESAVKKFRESQAWKKLIVGTGEFFIKNEQEENFCTGFCRADGAVSGSLRHARQRQDG